MSQTNEAPLDVQVAALVEQLTAAGKPDGAELVERLHSKLEFTNYWYGTRHKRLWQWAHDELSQEQRERYFSIVANGTAGAHEPPTYAQQYNTMQYRMEQAEQQRDKLLTDLEMLVYMVKTNAPDLCGQVFLNAQATITKTRGQT